MKTQSEQVNEFYMQLRRDAEEELKKSKAERDIFMKALQDDMLFIKSSSQKMEDDTKRIDEAIKKYYQEIGNCQSNDDTGINSYQTKC